MGSSPPTESTDNFMQVLTALGHIRDAGSTKGADRLVLIALLSRCANDGLFKCFPSYALLAYDAQVNIQTAKRSVRNLVQAGIVRRKVRRNQSNFFFINVSLLKEQAETALAETRRRREQEDADEDDFGEVERLSRRDLDRHIGPGFTDLALSGLRRSMALIASVMRRCSCLGFAWLLRAVCAWFGILSRQCLGRRRIPDLKTLRRESRAWNGPYESRPGQDQLEIRSQSRTQQVWLYSTLTSAGIGCQARSGPSK